MPVSLTHVGEEVIARMANELREDFLDLCGLLDHTDHNCLASIERMAHVEVPLCPYSGVAFDGAHRVDLIILLKHDLGIPFELKLGDTRLSKQRVDRDWLSGCSLSHNGTRFKGRMMSVLERKFPDQLPPDDLKVRLEDERCVKLTREWFVVARSSTLDRWSGEARPDFSQHVQLLNFECVVDRFGGKEKFNNAVRDLLCFDYYAEWFANS